jgi:hypothetical protein
MARIFHIFLAALVTITSVSVKHVFAGKLDKFEKDATRERPKRDHDRDDRRADRYRSDYDNAWGGGQANGFFSDLVVIPIHASWARIAGDEDRLTELGCDLRKPGDPLLPFVRFDASYLAIESDVDAFDYRVQLGYGTFAFELNQTRYEEDEPADRLDLYRLYGLLRLSFGDKIEVDLGLGGIILDGDERNSGFSATMPILVQVYDWLIVEFRPMWSQIKGSGIDEYELGFLFNRDFAAIKAGYRWTHSPQESLDGPFIGLSIRY